MWGAREANRAAVQKARLALRSLLLHSLSTTLRRDANRRGISEGSINILSAGQLSNLCFLKAQGGQSIPETRRAREARGLTARRAQRLTMPPQTTFAEDAARRAQEGELGGVGGERRSLSHSPTVKRARIYINVV